MKTEHDLRFGLQKLRKKAGFKSAIDFAERMGIPKDTYTGYEQGKGKVGISLAQAWEFCDVLGEALGRYVSLDELAGRESPADPTAATSDETRLLGLYRDTDQRGRDTIMQVAESQRGMEGQPAPAAVGE